MDRRLLLFAEVFLSLWCLSLQQGTLMTLCRGNSSVLARCGVDMTPFPGELPPGWGRMCEPGATQCDLSTQSTVESTQHYDQYQCDAETWNLTYLCLPANQSVDICQDVRQTREGNTSLVHGQLMASRGDNVACTCVVTRTPGQSGPAIQIRLYTRHLAQPSAAEAASCQGKLTLRDTLKTGPALCLLTTRPTGQVAKEVSLRPGYSGILNDTTSLTITYELDGGDTWGQDQLLPFALRLSGSGRYDIECGRSGDDVTQSTGSTVPPITTTTFHTDREFEATSVDNPSASATSPEGGGEGIIIGLSVALALALVVILVLVMGGCCLLRRRRLTPGKLFHAGEDHRNDMNVERQTRTSVASLALTTPTFVEKATQTANNNNDQEPSLSANNVSVVECQNDGRDVTMDTSGLYETVRDRDPAIQNRAVHQNEGQGLDGPNNEQGPYSVTKNQPTSHQTSTELALHDNVLYGLPVQPEAMARQENGMGQCRNYGNKAPDVY